MAIVLDAAQIAGIQSAVARLRQGDLTAGLRLTERELPQKKKRLDDALALLHPWSGDSAILRRIDPPDTARVEGWRSAYTALERRRTGNMERSRDLASQLQETTARINAIRDSAGRIGDEEAHSVLAAREQAWETHLAQLDRETANLFEKRMREMDAMASARLAGVQQLSELRTLTNALAAAKVAIERQEQLLAEIDGELRALRDEIRAETPDAMAIADDMPIAACLGRLDRWREARNTALSAWDALLEAEQHVAATRDELETERQSLAKALVSAGIEAADLPLPVLLQMADNLLSEQIALHDARRKTMLQAFDVETLADVRTALDRCATRDRLEADERKLGRLITGELRLASVEDAQAVLAV